MNDIAERRLGIFFEVFAYVGAACTSTAAVYTTTQEEFFYAGLSILLAYSFWDGARWIARDRVSSKANIFEGKDISRLVGGAREKRERDEN